MGVSTKRFIAGAVCPKCRQMDKTVVYHAAAWMYSECVSCGFKQQQQHAAEDVLAQKTEAPPEGGQ